MCGIAGMIDLAGRRPVPARVPAAMAQALIHRGPDEDGFLRRPGLALASRRLRLLDLIDGRQPLSNEAGDVWVVFNGELFDYPEKRAELEARGHRFRTRCDTELLPHLWEEYGEGFFDHLRGQFAFALFDERQQRLILGRDRFGICPLFWTRQGNWLLFASEIKALLASGLVPARPDIQGINHVFTFFSLPGPVTCFEGVRALLPGHFLDISVDGPTSVCDRVYWEMTFPDHGNEESGESPRQVVDAFEDVLLRAVDKRLRADVPVVSYLSGGVDSGMVVALARHVRAEPIPTFTIRVEDPRLDESARAAAVAHSLGCKPTVVRCGLNEVLNTYPELIQAAEGPVLDASCAALLLLAREVHARGYRAALTGEGADEWLAGYPWYKVHRLLSLLDFLPGVKLSNLLRHALLTVTGAPPAAWSYRQRFEKAAGGPNAWLNVYGMMSLARLRFFTRDLLAAVDGRVPYIDLGIDPEKLHRWHPLNRSIWFGARTLLPGLLLQAKGDRVAMHSSVETRYPFLDEDVFTFLAKLHPRWKLHGLRDKHLLRLLAARWLPEEVAHRPKAIFRAPFTFPTKGGPAYVNQLLSEESLRRAGYFDPAAVRHWREAVRQLRPGLPTRTLTEISLAGVFSTQLWHHTFIDGGLADLPSLAGASQAVLAAS